MHAWFLSKISWRTNVYEPAPISPTCECRHLAFWGWPRPGFRRLIFLESLEARISMVTLHSLELGRNEPQRHYSWHSSAMLSIASCLFTTELRCGRPRQVESDIKEKVTNRVRLGVLRNVLCDRSCRFFTKTIFMLACEKFHVVFRIRQCKNSDLGTWCRVTF